MQTQTRRRGRPRSNSPLRIEFVRPRLYPKQLEAIYAPQRYSLIEASTKSGKTVGCMVWLAEQAWLGKSGHEFWWIAPIYEQSRIVFRRLSRGLTRGSFVANQADCSLTLANGAVLRFKGADNPDCYTGDVEVLTDAGWRLFPDLDRTERVLTLNPDTNVAEWQ